jgi:hypothetical protein
MNHTGLGSDLPLRVTVVSHTTTSFEGTVRGAPSVAREASTGTGDSR